MILVDKVEIVVVVANFILSEVFVVVFISVSELALVK